MLELATDALTMINHPDIEKANYTYPKTNGIWLVIQKMPKEYRNVIADAIKKWAISINEEYKKL